MLTKLAIYLNEVQIDEEANSVRRWMVSFMTCPSPYILEKRKNRKYTLVLDLDETLISAKIDAKSKVSGYRIRYRPFCQDFIVKMSKLYEIVIFTSSILCYAREAISPFGEWVSHILTREHTIKQKGDMIKDISKIGRPLGSIIIVDNLPQNFKFQPENGIAIKAWHGNTSDTEL